LLNVLVLGGYGFFGARISRALAGDARIKLLIGGRDASKASGAALALGLPGERGLAIDTRDRDFSERLAALGVHLLIHTAGPFQEQAYDVPRAAIRAGCDYIDLADGRRFVAGIAELDAEARARGVSIVSGASSVPALTAAVIDRYLPRFAELASIRAGITSSAQSPGPATVRGIFGYVGKPFTRLENGEWVTVHGWTDLERHRFPAPLGARWLGACDVPDLDVLPKRYPSVRTVTFHAGFASAVGHLAVASLAPLVRAGLLRSAAPLAAPLRGLTRLIEPFISDRSGMFVELEGTGRDGKPLALTWNLLAARNHGPTVPCGASIALARRRASGDRLPAGATACVGLLSVEEYLEPLADLDLRELLPAAP
jgi:saccharopine dehydrogenase-like NADP-dependent oxidoreductase